MDKQKMVIESGFRITYSGERHTQQMSILLPISDSVSSLFILPRRYAEKMKRQLGIWSVSSALIVVSAAVPAGVEAGGASLRFFRVLIHEILGLLLKNLCLMLQWR